MLSDAWLKVVAKRPILRDMFPGTANAVVDDVTTLASDELLARSRPRFLLVSAVEAAVKVASSPFSCFRALERLLSPELLLCSAVMGCIRSATIESVILLKSMLLPIPLKFIVAIGC
jgi:hypothetical protein